MANTLKRTRCTDLNNFNKETKHNLFLALYGICVLDNANKHVLDEHYFSDEKMTIELCLSTCREKGYTYSGLQWQIECYCGNGPRENFKWAWFDKCDDKCAGNSDQICGGSNAMSIYSTPLLKSG